MARAPAAPAPALPRGVLHVVGAAIVEGGRCLAAQRSEVMNEPLRWEFPGGKVEPGEAPAEALAREIAEELGLVVAVGRWLGRGVGETSPRGETGGRPLVLDVYLARRRSGEVMLREHRAWGWFGATELAGLEWAAADVPILAPLAAVLGASTALGGGESAAYDLEDPPIGPRSPTEEELP